MLYFPKNQKQLSVIKMEINDDRHSIANPLIDLTFQANATGVSFLKLEENILKHIELPTLYRYAKVKKNI